MSATRKKSRRSKAKTKKRPVAAVSPFEKRLVLILALVILLSTVVILILGVPQVARFFAPTVAGEVPTTCDANTTGQPPCCAYPVSGGFCGDGLCEAAIGETSTNCPADCKPAAVCGNGIIEIGETCDDSNTANGDGCSSTCQTEVPTTPVAIIVLPATQGADKGDSLLYTASVFNNRGSDRTFGINVSCITGWTCNLSRTQFDIQDKGTENITISVISPATIPLETYAFTATARDVQAPTFNASSTFNYTVKVCTKAAPVLAIDKTNVSAKAGDKESFTVTVTNKDDCPGYFNYTSTCPTGWNCTLSKKSVANVQVGKNYTLNLGVASDSGASSGNYTINITATNIKDTTKSALTSVIYRVVVGKPPPPTAFCGDGFCNNNENTTSCPSDCVPPPPPPPPPTIAECGDNIAEGAEDCDGTDSLSCPGFCTSTCTCPFFVGDGFCDEAAGESAAISPQDCARPANFGLVLIIVLIILGIVGGLGYYVYRRGGLSFLSRLHGVSEPKKTSDLEPAVNTMLSQGYNPNEISSHLSDAGWSQSAVDRAVGSATDDQEQLGVLAQQFEVDVPTAEAKKAEKYARACIKKGFKPSQVRAALKSAGWPSSTTDDVIDKLTSEHVESEAKKAGVSKPSENLDQLESYVSKELKEGHTPQQIKKVLQDAGWSDSAIRQVLP